MLWPLMNAEAFKAEQMFRKHQLFLESLQRVAECWESELDRSIQWGVGGSDLYAFGLPVLLLRRALGVCSCRICQCVLGWLCAFNHISDFCLFIHKHWTLFFMSLRSTLQRSNSRTLKRSGCSWCASVLPPGWDASLLGKSVTSFPVLKRSTCRWETQQTWAEHTVSGLKLKAAYLSEPLFY